MLTDVISWFFQICFSSKCNLYRYTSARSGPKVLILNGGLDRETGDMTAGLHSLPGVCQIGYMDPLLLQPFQLLVVILNPKP